MPFFKPPLRDLQDLLPVPEEWGSFRIGMFKDASKKEFVDSRERNRRNLRRHIGLLATNQGNYHHFNGLKLFEDGKKAEAQVEFDKAFGLYELVLNEIDPDNLAAAQAEGEKVVREKVTAGARQKVEQQVRATLKAMNEGDTAAVDTDAANFAVIPIGRERGEQRNAVSVWTDEHFHNTCRAADVAVDLEGRVRAEE